MNGRRSRHRLERPYSEPMKKRECIELASWWNQHDPHYEYEVRPVNRKLYQVYRWPVDGRMERES